MPPVLIAEDIAATHAVTTLCETRTRLVTVITTAVLTRRAILLSVFLVTIQAVTVVLNHFTIAVRVVICVATVDTPRNVVRVNELTSAATVDEACAIILVIAPVIVAVVFLLNLGRFRILAISVDTQDNDLDTPLVRMAISVAATLNDRYTDLAVVPTEVNIVDRVIRDTLVNTATHAVAVLAA